MTVYPALVASQVASLSQHIADLGGYPVYVFQRGRINEVAAYHTGEWVGSVAADPDGPGLVVLDESGKSLRRTSSPEAAARCALWRDGCSRRSEDTRASWRRRSVEPAFG